MNLITFRRNAKKTQNEIAKIINVAPTTYLGYEKGTSEPSIKTLMTLADYFNTTIDALVGHETRHIIDTSAMSLAKIELINQIKQLDENAVNSLNGFLQGILYAEKERQNIINQVNNYKEDK